MEQTNKLSVNNSGEMYVANRAARRTFQPDNPDKTKSTWSRQTKSELKRKRKLGRK